MLVIHLSEPDLFFMGMIRVALSEKNQALREIAIRNVKHDVKAQLLSNFARDQGVAGLAIPENARIVQWSAKTADQHTEAAWELSNTGRRYEDSNERKLNIAEYIGVKIWASIREGRFEGVQTKRGILQQVRKDAEAENVRGARDKDTLRSIWKTYRGVVHLGMALDYCVDNPDQNFHVLHLADFIQRTLSENCPKGTSKPYVDPDEQISFVYITDL